MSGSMTVCPVIVPPRAGAFRFVRGRETVPVSGKRAMRPAGSALPPETGRWFRRQNAASFSFR